MVVLEQGSRAPEVRELQVLLKRKGFDAGQADGEFGPKSKTAVMAFQGAPGLKADGVVGPKTWAALRASPPASQPTLEKDARGAAVVELQRKLAAHGFSPGPMDGVLGPGTEAAVKSFQKSKGLVPDGVVGPKTWAALAAAPSRPTEPGPTTGGVSVKELRSIMPHLSATRGNEVLPQLNKAMAEADINTPKRQAAFLAQLAHESAEFRFFEELASGAAYEGREDLGNTQPGDG